MTYSINTPSWRIMRYRKYYLTHITIDTFRYTLINRIAMAECKAGKRPVTVLIY